MDRPTIPILLFTIRDITPEFGDRVGVGEIAVGRLSRHRTSTIGRGSNAGTAFEHSWRIGEILHQPGTCGGKPGASRSSVLPPSAEVAEQIVSTQPQHVRGAHISILHPSQLRFGGTVPAIPLFTATSASIASVRAAPARRHHLPTQRSAGSGVISRIVNRRIG